MIRARQREQAAGDCSSCAWWAALGEFCGAAQRQNVGFSGDRKGFRTPCDKTIPLTRRLRVASEVDGESRGLDHDVSSMAGAELTTGRLTTGIMWPRWQTGSRRERPVSLSYRSR